MTTPIGQWAASDVSGMTVYVLLPNDYNPDTPYPVMLYLHQLDMGQDPTGLIEQVNPWFNSAAFREDHPCIVVMPLLNQAGDMSGQTINWGGLGPADTDGERNAIAALKQVIADHKTDPSKVYVTGISMGAIGAYDMLIKYNAYTGTEGKIFAAGLILAGADYGQGYPHPNASVVAALKDVPLHAIHGSKDTQVPLDWDRNLFAAIKAANGRMTFIEDEALGHNVWDAYYTLGGSGSPLAWLFNQAVPAATAAPSAPRTTMAAATSNVVIITPGSGSFKDAKGNTYQLTADGVAMENDKPIPGGSGTAQMAWDGTNVFGQDGSSKLWYTWNQSGWSLAASGPVSPASNTPATSPATTTPAGSSAANAAAVIAYLKSISGTKTVSGQFIERGPITPITTIASQTGCYLGMIGGDYWWFNAPLSAGADYSFNKIAIDHWQNGGLVTLSLSMPNPGSTGGIEDGAPCSFPDLLTSGTATNKNFVTLLDQIATGLAPLDAANVPVLLRFAHEGNGGWFWFGKQNSSNDQFKQFWKMAHDYLTITKGLKNLIWVYAANPGFPMTDRFPGVGLVDVVGMDLYTDTPVDLADYNALAATGLPVGICEFGPNSPSGGDKNFDLTVLVNDISNSMPGIVYWLNWWDQAGGTNPGWGMAECTNVKAALSMPRVVNRGGIKLSGLGPTTTQPAAPATPAPTPASPSTPAPQPAPAPAPAPALPQMPSSVPAIPSLTITNSQVAGCEVISGTHVSVTRHDGLALNIGSEQNVAVLTGPATVQLSFVAFASIALTAGAGNVVVVADEGANDFTSGSRSLDVTGGSGACTYHYGNSSASLTIRDFSTAKGDTLRIASTLASTMKAAAYGGSGSRLTFSSGAGSIILINVAPANIPKIQVS